MKRVTTHTATAIAASVATIAAVTTFKGSTTPPTPPNAATAEATTDPIPLGPVVNPAALIVVGYDADGFASQEVWDIHPLAFDEILQTGPGDTNRDGMVNLEDLNLVLTNFGTEY